MASPMLQACERCWKRKQRCDRQKPQCGNCKAASKPCRERLMGAVLDPSDPSAHYSYIETLKRRVQLLQHQLDSASPKGSTSPSVYSNTTSLEVAATAGPSHVSKSPTLSRPTGLDVQDQQHQQHYQQQQHNDMLQEEMGHLSLSAMAEFADKKGSSPPTISSSALFSAATAVSGSNVSTSKSSTGALKGSMVDFHRNLVRQGVAFTASQTSKPFASFIEWCQHSSPFIDACRIKQDYSETLQSHERANVSCMAAENPEKAVRAYLGVALGILMSAEHRHLENYAVALVLSAKQYMALIQTHASDLDTIQCLTLFVMFSLRNEFGGSAWLLLGLAITRCMSGGTHSSRRSDATSEDLEKVQNSKAFWALYIFDAILSSTLGRPFLLQNEDITATPPTAYISRSDTLDPDSLFCWNIHHAKLLRDIACNKTRNLLFHFSNYKHWKDCAPVAGFSESDLGQLYYRHRARCICLALVSMLQRVDESTVRNYGVSVLVDEASIEFSTYVRMLDEGKDHNTTWDMLDGMQLFALGASLILVTTLRQPPLGTPPRRMFSSTLSSVRTISRLLSEISYRQKPIRELAALLDLLLDMIALMDIDPDTSAKLEAKMYQSEVSIPLPVKDMIMLSVQLLRTSTMSR